MIGMGWRTRIIGSKVGVIQQIKQPALALHASKVRKAGAGGVAAPLNAGKLLKD